MTPCTTLPRRLPLAGFDHLPAAAIDAAKKSLLDTLGVMLAASGTEPAVRAAIDLATEAGGKPEASIPGIDQARWGRCVSLGISRTCAASDGARGRTSRPIRRSAR